MNQPTESEFLDDVGLKKPDRSLAIPTFIWKRSKCKIFSKWYVNIGINCGEVAGQTIFHCHVHLIPRRKGDVENPRGGVRHIIEGKGFY